MGRTHAHSPTEVQCSVYLTNVLYSVLAMRSNGK